MDVFRLCKNPKELPGSQKEIIFSSTIHTSRFLSTLEDHPVADETEYRFEDEFASFDHGAKDLSRDNIQTYDSIATLSCFKILKALPSPSLSGSSTCVGSLRGILE